MKQVTPTERSRAAGLIPVMENKIDLKIIQSAVNDIAKVDPEAGTRLGATAHNAVWDPANGADTARRVEILDHYSQLMQRSVDFSKLTPGNRIKAQLLEYGAKQEKRRLKFRDYRNLINPDSGPQVRLPLFLITSQPAKTLQDFKDYISRLRAFEPYVDDVIATTKKRRAAGILLPAAGMKTVAQECRGLTSGQPFSKTGDPSPLLDDFQTRARLSKLDSDTRRVLVQQVRNALENSVGPGCGKLTAYAAGIAADSDKGVWSLPEGQAFYAERLAWYTSTKLTAQKVYDLAIQQMSDITSDIEDVMNHEGFEGSPAQYMQHLRGETKYRIASDPATIQKWLNKVGSYILALDASLDDMLAPRPDTDLDVREMEPFQQPSGVTAGYYSNDQLGIYYVNLGALPGYEVEAVTFRFSIPGEHAIPISPLNRIVDVPAFTDGWSLYSLRLPLKFGYYKEKRTKLGRMLVTATAIAQAVVDVGIHAKQWDRQEATRYLLNHSPMSRVQAQKAVDRILAEPGKATAAVVGAATISRLQNECKQALGKAFSQKAFNKVVLQHGPVPMPMLEVIVKQWLEHQLDGKTH